MPVNGNILDSSLSILSSSFGSVCLALTNGLLIETFFVYTGIEFIPTSSMTQEREASAQADESYCLGELKPVPDLSI